MLRSAILWLVAFMASFANGDYSVGNYNGQYYWKCRSNGSQNYKYIYYAYGTSTKEYCTAKQI